MLYRREEKQFAKYSAISPNQYNINSRPGSAADNSEHNGKLGVRKHGVSESDSVVGGHGLSMKVTRLSSSIKDDSVGSSGSGTATPTLHGHCGGSGHPQSSKSHVILDQVHQWQLLPDTMYLAGDPSPRLTGV